MIKYVQSTQVSVYCFIKGIFRKTWAVLLSYCEDVLYIKIPTLDIVLMYTFSLSKEVKEAVAVAFLESDSVSLCH